MCCICSICRCGCKLLKWILIITAITVLILVIVIVIVVVVALHGTETLQDLIGMAVVCARGEPECPSPPGVFYKVVEGFIVPGSYQWSCEYTNEGDILNAGWGVAFEMRERQTLGITLKPQDGRDPDEVLTLFFNFKNPDLGLPDDTDRFNLDESLIQPTRVNIVFRGGMNYAGSADSENKQECRTEGVCRARLEKISAHFILKFNRIPDWLCPRFDADNIAVLKFLQDLARVIGRIWSGAEEWIISLTQFDHFTFPKGTVRSKSLPLNIEYSDGCVFSPDYVGSDTA